MNKNKKNPQWCIINTGAFWTFWEILLTCCWLWLHRRKSYKSQMTKLQQQQQHKWSSLKPSVTGPSCYHKCFPLPSDMTCSGTARVYHSDHPPSYTDTPGCPHSWAASATWHAVTAEPHKTQSGRSRSTPARANRAWSCSFGRKCPEGDRKAWKGMLMEPGMWPGSVSVNQKEQIHSEYD